MRDGGKGDMQRPLGVTMDKFDEAWELIFSKKPVKTYTGNKPNYVIPIAEDVDNHEKECGK